MREWTYEEWLRECELYGDYSKLREQCRLRALAKADRPESRRRVLESID